MPMKNAFVLVFDIRIRHGVVLSEPKGTAKDPEVVNAASGLGSFGVFAPQDDTSLGTYRSPSLGA
jgi:hypothetical protein